MVCSTGLRYITSGSPTFDVGLPQAPSVVIYCATVIGLSDSIICGFVFAGIS